MSGKIIYVLGCNRSGTTLLQNLFRCTEDTEIINGEISPIAVMMYSDRIGGENPKNIVAKRIMNNGFGMFGPAHFPINTVRVSEMDPTLWIEWAKIWQDINYVHIRRDPRDALVSKMNGKQYVNRFVMWQKAEQIYEKMKEANSENTYLIKYEELVNDVETIMGNLVEQIGLTKILEFNNWHALLTERDLKHPSMIWLNSPRPISSESVGRWRQDKSRIKLIANKNTELIDAVKHYGYELDDSWLDELK